MIAALFVETDGCYFGLPDVDPWDIHRDARNYSGPWPVVAHPPCQRWGRYWHGSPNAPHQFRKGEDHGCFATALTAVRNYGGVLEHPAHSHAWAWFGLAHPPETGWGRADQFGGVTCYVEQGHYGHISRKGTWLYSVGCWATDMRWGPSEQKIHPVALAKHGYAKARRIGMMAMIGGKDKTIIRNATPPEFRDALLQLARHSTPSNPEPSRAKGDGSGELLGDSPPPTQPVRKNQKCTCTHWGFPWCEIDAGCPVHDPKEK